MNDYWSEGYDAARLDLRQEDNPYDYSKNSYAYCRWSSGWYDYMYSDPEDNYCGGY